MKNTTKNTLLNFGLGMVVLAIAFFSVTGNVFQRLDPSIPTIAQETPQPVASPAPTTTQVKTPPKTTQTTTTSSPTTPATSTSTPSSSGYTLAQVTTHNSASSCWSAINNEVFDLTSWVNRHPGGKASILMICGKDGSALFNMQHGRSNRVNSILDGFKIGALKA